jgi:hypothetical protein
VKHGLRLALVWVAALAPLAAEPAIPLGILRAELLLWEGSWDGGTLRLKLDTGQAYACAFDARSFFERDRVRISPGRLRPGDRLEVVSDRTSNATACFARIIKVMTGKEEPLVWGSVTRATEHFAPRGTLLYSGVVVADNGERFTLRLRSGERAVIRLRRDTRFLRNGQVAGREILLINVGLFVRAGLGFDDEIEAYSIVSGEILQPRAPGSRLP